MLTFVVRMEMEGGGQGYMYFLKSQMSSSLVQLPPPIMQIKLKDVYCSLESYAVDIATESVEGAWCVYCPLCEDKYKTTSPP